MSNTEAAAVICIVAAATALIRGLPYLVFGKRELPDMAVYLGNVLPGAIMVILVVYCLRGIRLTGFPYGGPELLATLCVALLQIWRKNTLLSVSAGTILYMILIRTVFSLPV